MGYRRDNQEGNHRTKKKGAKGSNKREYQPFDGDAFLKQLQQERKAANISTENSKKS